MAKATSTLPLEPYLTYWRQRQAEQRARRRLAKEAYFPALAQVNKVSQCRIDLKPLEDLDAHFEQRILATGQEVPK